MSRALAQLVRRAFGTLKLHRLEANIHPANAASIALAVCDGLAGRLAAQHAQVAAAERSLSLVDPSWRLGSRGRLELLDVQRQLATALQGLVTLRQTEQAHRAALQRSLGALWGDGPG